MAKRSAEPPQAAAPAALGRVLCATDLSEFGNRAVALAFAICAEGGRVTLLHVLHVPELPSPLFPHYGEKHPDPEERARQERECRGRLEALARAAAAGRRVSHEARVVPAAHVADAIVGEAERLGEDAICLATHSRTGLAQLVLGSTAHEVLHRSGRPVLLVPSPVAPAR
jgi:nucleotide-binding universal stress UspA family protein